MNFLVLSRTKARKFSYKANTMPYIMISITDIALKNVVFNRDEEMQALLRLKFDDTDVQCANAISQGDAKRIADFVEKWKEEVELIVVHCEAGVSRSAGVCAALMKWLNGDDTPIFGNAYYKPNMRCYRMVLNELMMRDDEAEKPLKGPFWTICKKTTTEGVEFDEIITYPVACTMVTPSHIEVWQSVCGTYKGDNWNYYPRGRVEIRREVAIVFAHPMCFLHSELEMVLREKFCLGDMDIIYKADNSRHYQNIFSTDDR